MRTILLIQSVYFLITALWPLVHIKSFMLITGYKKEQWLVKTVAVLILSIGVAMLAAVMMGISMPILILAACSCLSLLVIDIYYVSKAVIRSVYLLDALVEAGFLVIIGINI